MHLLRSGRALFLIVITLPSHNRLISAVFLHHKQISLSKKKLDLYDLDFFRGEVWTKWISCAFMEDSLFQHILSSKQLNKPQAQGQWMGQTRIHSYWPWPDVVWLCEVCTPILPSCCTRQRERERERISLCKSILLSWDLVIFLQRLPRRSCWCIPRVKQRDWSCLFSLASAMLL